MCGISGIKRMGKNPLKDSTPIGFEQIQQLLTGLEHRGTHATGMCFQYPDGSLKVLKAPEVAWKFVADKGTQKWVEKNLTDDVVTVILHNRAWTVGRPEDNRNNHPVFAGRTAIVHNGGIGNHGELFNRLKLKREAEVDSDIIRAILDEYGLTTEGVKALNQMNGYAAIAAVSQDFPDKLLLGRSGSPLVVAALPDANQLMWASEKEAIHAAARAWTRRWRMWFKENHKDLLFNPMEREVIALIGNEGEEWHADFSASGGRTRSIIYRQYDTMPEKRKEMREHENRKVATEKSKEPAPQVPQKPARMKCPSVTCGTIIKFHPHQMETPLWKLQCPDCGQRLGDEA